MVTYRTAARAAHEIKVALVAAMRTLYADNPDVLVTFGHPGPQVANYLDAVAFTAWRATQEPATLTASKRTRDVEIRVTFIASCWRPGGSEVEETAALAAVQIHEELEDYLRDTDPTLGGRAWRVDVVEHESEGETDPKALAEGRTIELQADVVAHVRITS